METIYKNSILRDGNYFYYMEIVKMNGKRIKIEITPESHAFTHHAAAKIWNKKTNSWKMIMDIDCPKRDEGESCNYRTTQECRETLVKLVSEILFS